MAASILLDYLHRCEHRFHHLRYGGKVRLPQSYCNLS